MDWYADDTWIVLTAALAATSCALLGCFLVLRQMSMMGDAISHAILPGLALAYLWTGDRSSLAMFVGAAVVGVLTAVFTQWVHRFGNVERGASMGIVFTTLFALGLLLMVSGANHVDLDPGCVLYGALEWVPLDTLTVAGFEVPQATAILAGVLVVNLCVLLALFKELRLSAFDPALATTLGIGANAMHYLLMTLVAVTAVAAFEAVGSIIVIAMFIVPAATAQLVARSLPVMLVLSVGFGVLAAFLGHVVAVVVPSWFGFSATTTSGSIAFVAGLLFAGMLGAMALKQATQCRHITAPGPLDRADSQ